MKSFRTYTKTVEVEEPYKGHFKPKFKVDDYVEIYSGRYEGLCFTIKDIRWNNDNSYQYSVSYKDKYNEPTGKLGFEYLGPYGWQTENNISR